MYALNIDKETNRILSACVVLEEGNYEGMPIVDSFPEGSVADYLYIDGEYVHSPLPEPEIVEAPTQLDRIEAQVTYTAMMTDTMLESEGEA
ncbi:MAG: hypothetical protein IKU47_07165 [Oscillospiraceae bacterium]|nr:hypothetical protein [Oscillospiraceae bacterium]